MAMLKNYLTLLILGLFLFFSGGPDLAAAAPPATGEAQTEAPFRYEPSGYVTVPRLNVRFGPSLQQPIVTVLPYWEMVYLVARNTPGNWLQVRLPQGQQGWVMAQYISASPEEVANLPVNDTHNIPPEVPPSVPVEATGYVTIPRLNVRSGPGLNQAVVGQVWRGERLPLIGRNTNSTWVQIRLSHYGKGWVSAQFIQSFVPISSLPITEMGTPEPTIHNGTVMIYNLNVRSGPGFQHRIIGRLQQGQQLNVYGRDASGTWLKVGFPYGPEGWVMAQYVQIEVPVASLSVM